MSSRPEPWGTIELEDEVRNWLLSMPPVQFRKVAGHIDRLQERGVLLSEPYTRQLRGKLRELRFWLDGTPWRVAYYITTDRRIVLLTAFRKTQRREAAEIARAERAMRKCIELGHVAQEEML